MIARIRSVQGDQLRSDTGDPARARQRGRTPIPLRDRGGAAVSQPGTGELLLHLDNIADAAGTKTEGRSVRTQP